jgi:excisionase family DNA binding protein
MRTMTVSQACAVYGTSRTTIMRYGQEGRLTIHRVGPRLIRLDVDELDREFHGALISNES